MVYCFLAELAHESSLVAILWEVSLKAVHRAELSQESLLPFSLWVSGEGAIPLLRSLESELTLLFGEYICQLVRNIKCYLHEANFNCS